MKILYRLGIALMAWSAFATASAQEWPARPIRLVNGAITLSLVDELN